MDIQPESRSSSRDTYLALLIVLLVGIPCFLFLNILTVGLFLLLPLAAVGVAFLAGLNYLLWGWSFDCQVEKEREDALERELLEEWPYEDPPTGSVD